MNEKEATKKTTRISRKRAVSTRLKADATPGGILELSLGVAGRHPEGERENLPEEFEAETIPEIVRELRSLGETHYSARIMAAWQRARHNFNVQLSTLRKKADMVRPNIKAVNKAVNETVNKAVNETVNAAPLSLPLEKEETKEKNQKKVRVASSCSCCAADGGVAAAAAARSGDNVLLESDAMRPSEAMVRHFATEVVQLNKEAVDEWLKEAEANEWHFPNGERITRSNFRAPLRSFERKYLERRRREAEAAKNGGAGQPERRYMTWQERAAAEREAAEEERQQWLIELSHQLKL